MVSSKADQAKGVLRVRLSSQIARPTNKSQINTASTEARKSALAIRGKSAEKSGVGLCEARLTVRPLLRHEIAHLKQPDHPVELILSRVKDVGENLDGLSAAGRRSREEHNRKMHCKK